MLVNKLTQSLAPYPMEELIKIKQKLKNEGKQIFDFGTGDPKIPTWPPIVNAIKEAIPQISQYPSAKGTSELEASEKSYLKRRFNIDTSDIAFAPTRGSKEAIFHSAFSIIDRSKKKKTIIFPNPGYPVYKASTIFAGGRPYPVDLSPPDYLLEPWKLPLNIQNDAAAIWINYPHNPTGASCDKEYFSSVIKWAHKFNCILFSDDCYVDIYEVDFDNFLYKRPISPLMLEQNGVISFFSLSKRSGMTGYRVGFMAGDPDFITPHLKARANFGIGIPDFIQKGASIAWNDDEHVKERRKIFTSRIQTAFPVLAELEMLDKPPIATSYLWCKLPKKHKDDVKFCLDLAQKGVITSPSSWLSGGKITGYLRFALVEKKEQTLKALEILKKVIKGD